MRVYLSGMPELRLGLNDKVLFESTGRGKSKSVELEDVKFHQCVRLSRLVIAHERTNLRHVLCYLKYLDKLDYVFGTTYVKLSLRMLNKLFILSLDNLWLNFYSTELVYLLNVHISNGSLLFTQSCSI
jgi:hypothetical protein